MSPPATSRTALASQTQNGVPSELLTAVDQAGSRYGVNPGLLIGIWRKESGSTFPNPYVNSSGYGGLFGTQDWQGSTQEQANLAASILAAGYKAGAGNTSAALSYYNTGRVDSPAGFQYAAQVEQLAGEGATPVATPPQVLQSVARPGATTGNAQGVSSSGGSFWGGVLGDLESAGGAVVGTVESAGQDIWSDIAGAESALTGTLDFLKAALWLVNPVSWLRMVEVVVGGVLAVFGVAVLTGVAAKVGGVLEKAAGAIPVE